MNRKEYIVTFSFDDGWHLDMRVAELLKKHKLTATFYIVVNWVGEEGYLTWSQVKQIDKEGFEIGSHSCSHPPDLKKLYDEELHYEVQNSKELIESVLNKKVTSFCYPRGRADERVKRFVARAGYVEARGTDKPGVTEVKDRLYLPGTIHIYQREEYGKKPILEFARGTIDRVVREGGYCNIFSHSKEIDRDKNWGVLEEVLKYASHFIKR